MAAADRAQARFVLLLALLGATVAEIIPFRPTPTSPRTTAAVELVRGWQPASLPTPLAQRIPLPPQTTSDGSAVRCSFTFEAGSSGPADDAAADEAADLPPDVALQRLAGRCFKLHQDQWAYEACAGRSIRQSSGAETFNLGSLPRRYRCTPHPTPPHPSPLFRLLRAR